jgi:hypothetical protein
MNDQLPAVLPTRALAPVPTADTYIVPALIAALGDQASWRYVEFFAANIRNPNTRRAYVRACSRFFAWCEDRGLTLTPSGRSTLANGSSSCRRTTGRRASSSSSPPFG